MKKFKLDSEHEELIHHLVSKQLDKYGITTRDIQERYPDGKIEGEWWYSYYTQSEDEYKEWKKYCIDILTNGVTPKRGKKWAEKEFPWLSLMYGLRQE